MVLKSWEVCTGSAAILIFGGLALRCCRKRDSEGMIVSTFLALASICATLSALV
jgi:hypothetical protein